MNERFLINNVEKGSKWHLSFLVLDINDDYFWACLNDKGYVLPKPDSTMIYGYAQKLKV